MTEWDAAGYAKRSALQEAMAQEVLALLHFEGHERVLDVGCGDGRITAGIAERMPQGYVIGVDASSDMIAFAREHGVPSHPNLQFEVCDARNLPFRGEFDLVVSFNALHWLPEQALALRGIHAALKPAGRAQLRLVPTGARKSLEAVLEETRQSERWAGYFEGFRDPYLRLTQEQYAQLAEENGFRVFGFHTESKSWDFKTRDAFFKFGEVTFVEWTRRVPDSEKSAFITDVLDRYRKVGAANADANTRAPVAQDDNVFHFYQLDISLEHLGL
jgi:trans-aconitate 2-methyltransferase